MLDGGKLFRDSFVQCVMNEVKHVQHPRYVIKTFWNSGIVDDKKHNSFVVAWDTEKLEWCVQSIPWIVLGFRSHKVKYTLNRPELISTWRFPEMAKIVQLMYHCFSLEISDIDLDDLFCEVKLFEMCEDGNLKLLYCSRNADAISVDRWIELIEHMLNIILLLTEGSRPAPKTKEKRQKKRARVETNPLL